MSSKISIADLNDIVNQNKKISAVSCYDFTTARLISQTDIEMILVGDSAAQSVLGYDSTLPATMDFMVTITSAVRRGAPDKFLVADMPFLSYHLGTYEAIKNAGRFIAESGAQMVKIEAKGSDLDAIKAISNAGIATMAHIGIRPQSISKVGRFKAEATTAEMAVGLIHLADQMRQAGAAALLLEGTATEVAKIITERSEVPVIGIGSGNHCDGQILVVPDILGLLEEPYPKFVKNYANLAEETKKAVTAYDMDVKNTKYPDDSCSYHMKKGEFEKLQKLI